MSVFSKKGYILSLGGGASQVPFLEVCKKNGYKLITVDQNPVCPGFSLSDLKIVESITEYRRIYSFMLKTLLDSPIVAVGCRSFGRATLAAAYLSEKLGVPGNPFESVKKIQNKAQTMRHLADAGISVPEQIPMSKWKNSESISESLFPFIVKPISGSGKKGIELIENKSAWKAYNKQQTGEVYAERFIEGKEFTVLGFVQNGVFSLVSFSDKITTNYPPYLELAHLLPASLPDLTGEIKFACQRIVRILDFRNGPFVAEFKIDRQKNIYLIEVAPEIGGEYIAEKLLYHHYGYDYFEDYLRLILGQPIQLYDKTKKINKETLIRFLAPPPGKFRLISYKRDNEKARGDIFFDHTLKHPGEIVNSTDGNSSRFRVIGYSREKSAREEYIPDKAAFLEVELEEVRN